MNRINTAGIFPMAPSQAGLPNFHPIRRVGRFEQLCSTAGRMEPELVLGHLVYLWQCYGNWSAISVRRIIEDQIQYEREYNRKWRWYSIRYWFWSGFVFGEEPQSPTMQPARWSEVEVGILELCQKELLIKGEDPYHDTILFPTQKLAEKLRDWGYIEVA